MDAIKFFGTSDLYEILEVSPNASTNTSMYLSLSIKKIHRILLLTLYFIWIELVKKSYYRLARAYHPDKNSGAHEFSAGKFNVIYQAYSILSDTELRLKYDSEGSKVIFAKGNSIASEWENYLKTTTVNDINDAAEAYKGSVDEKNDILKQIVAGKGSMIHVLNTVPFMRKEDENRIIGIIQEAISSGEIQRIAIKKIPKNY